MSQIKNLNLWGSELEDVTAVKDLPNLEICSLSLNKIKTLAPFQHCRKLTELYLRKNSIENLADIRYLQTLPLKVLWLWDNPICQHPNYRQYIVKVLPNLVKLDNTAVTPEERQVCTGLNEQDLIGRGPAEQAYSHHNTSVEQKSEQQQQSRHDNNSSTPSTTNQRNISSAVSSHSRASGSQPGVGQSRQASANNLRSKSPKILPQGGVVNQANQQAAAQQQPPLADK